MFNDYFLLFNLEGILNEGVCVDVIVNLVNFENYYGCCFGLIELVGLVYKVIEELLVYYVMVNFSGEKFRGNVGICVVDI